MPEKQGTLTSCPVASKSVVGAAGGGESPSGARGKRHATQGAGEGTVVVVDHQVFVKIQSDTKYRT